MSFHVVYMLPVFYTLPVGYVRFVCVFCGNFWWDKDVCYIIVCYVYVNSMFVSGGGGGWICQPVVGGGAFS